MEKLENEISALARMARYESANVIRHPYAGQALFDIQRHGQRLELVADMYSVQFCEEETLDASIRFSPDAWDQEKLVLPAVCNRKAFYQLYRTGRQLVQSKRRLLQLELK
ncbi:hypothetical protein HZU77_013500 [Neisseriaceae bacterium TC5R-5]|nr:hypothetical protein [Neisseriaceae bacterium TC5R-5]